jgi:hypothetical protein
MDMVKVNGKDVMVVEYRNERVLLTEQVAQVYECETQQIQQNYANNKNRFTEGKHYYKLEGDELRSFKNCFENFEAVGIGKRTAILYLWTRQGASRHCKMVNTDKAWDMFDCLEENYFNPPQKEMTEAEIVAANAMRLVEQERRMAHIEFEMATIKDTQRIQSARMDTLNGVCVDGDKQQKLNAMIRKYANTKGIQYATAWKDFVTAFNTAFHANLKALIRHYCEKNEVKKLSVPAYLMTSDKIDDGLLVADKMLNTVHDKKPVLTW